MGTPNETPPPSFSGKWWTYQKERFPLLAHGPLIAAFSACAVSYSSLLRQAPVPGWEMYFTAFVVCLLMFLQLRIADEFKDFEDDSRWRPYRAVPRGLVKLSELRVVFILAAAIQLGLVLWLDLRLLWVLGIAWTYLALMSVEFFCREWLKARPVVYLVSHMGIMPLVDFFGTACEWLPRAGKAPAGLGWFLAASFCNGIVIELGRKLRQPADEEEGVETYSALWGVQGGATVWVFMLFWTWYCALKASQAIGFAFPVSCGLGAVLLVAMAAVFGYAHRGMSGKKIEAVSAVWTLALYLLLGLVPLVLRR
ncbi:UbiA family prenyltransferase [Haloferula sp. BvORR071]|uniref:UbiA family prenyltransferase n=1 Tax=Haloferula sp. BvORR071 TaxID=1396141 RepID=UPI0005552E87|nr:UbiA family prenyltransferase [Haloferula sp. BvORR071]